jgi:hypothetical protein
MYALPNIVTLRKTTQENHKKIRTSPYLVAREGDLVEQPHTPKTGGDAVPGDVFRSKIWMYNRRRQAT